MTVVLQQVTFWMNKSLLVWMQSSKYALRQQASYGDLQQTPKPLTISNMLTASFGHLSAVV